jgi:hypothetical protein
METLTKQASRNDAIAGVIDKVLTQVFGKEATTLIYRHLECNYAVRRNEIGENIELFTRGLEDFLRSGARVIERKILEDINSDSNLLRRFELENVDDDVNFVTKMRWFMQKT